MKAIGYLQSLAITEDDALMDIEIPTPTATGRDLLVKVNAISVNPVDTKVRKNAEPQNGEHKVLGWDVAGEVVAVGENTERFQVGDKVWYAGDITRPGANSEYHLVDERIVGHKPKTLSDSQAAAVPLTAITAWELLFDRLKFDRLEPGHKVKATKRGDRRLLIVGAAGGVGSILTQLATKLTDATVIGTASRPSSQEWVSNLGADHVIDHSKELSEELARIGIDSVTDVISLTHTGQHFGQLVEVLAPQGRFALIDDPQPQELDVLQLKRKSLSLHWELMFTRSMFNTEDIDKQGELLNSVAGMIDRDILKTTLGENYGTINADNLRRAHIHIESGKAIGKVVLEGF
ncbi:zinc-binding alcohol dehydrogenase family protein [Motiliproteus sp. MSK22-1]|uniref:zinc-binding alcohol dehydrogenase family protein n=1 Tax=Motiliproteus sp. MSK22-1 TaxID=1897630 RepID=UPI000976E4FE|nr:zinc-binding alcohol dehydrogenase family protein [Motiliproteus sp. MSK22-1]OMH30442.1 NADPH:quinone reductase [Motiliproteus sp. MSK22-1]